MLKKKIGTINYKKYVASQRDWAEKLTKRYEDADEDEIRGCALRREAEERQAERRVFPLDKQQKRHQREGQREWEQRAAPSSVAVAIAAPCRVSAARIFDRRIRLRLRVPRRRRSEPVQDHPLRLAPRQGRSRCGCGQLARQQREPPPAAATAATAADEWRC